jgi:hypothetical protein
MLSAGRLHWKAAICEGQHGTRCCNRRTRRRWRDDSWESADHVLPLELELVFLVILSLAVIGRAASRPRAKGADRP